MAFLDDQNLYSDAQALTATAASTDLIDHGADGNLGIGEPMVVQITLDVLADNTTTDETYSAALQTDDNASFSSAVTVGSVTITAGSAAGTRFFIPVPPSTSMERYSRINYTLGGTTPTVTVTSALLPVKFVDNYVSYADGITIS
jgi:hypothetical protein